MPLEDALAAVYAPGGTEPVGAGLLVDDDLVITCAHVVNRALGRPIKANGRPPLETIELRFLADSAYRVAASLDPENDAWSDPPAGRQRGADLCLLRIKSGFRATIRPAKLRAFADPTGRQFRAAGFPANWPVDFATGEVTGKGGDGLFLLRPPSATFAVISSVAKDSRASEDKDLPGVIRPGFSGGAVEIDGSIAGHSRINFAHGESWNWLRGRRENGSHRHGNDARPLVSRDLVVNDGLDGLESGRRLPTQ